jgi:hypothetical protein
MDRFPQGYSIKVCRCEPNLPTLQCTIERNLRTRIIMSFSSRSVKSLQSQGEPLRQLFALTGSSLTLGGRAGIVMGDIEGISREIAYRDVLGLKSEWVG